MGERVREIEINRDEGWGSMDSNGVRVVRTDATGGAAMRRRRDQFMHYPGGWG